MSRIPLATRRRSRTQSVLLWTSALLLLSGCLPGGRSPGDPFSAQRAEAPGRLSVEVQNLNFNDLTVYAVRQGQQIRLGNVTGKSDKEFSLAWDFAHGVRFRIDAVGGQSCNTREIPVDPGATAWIQVPANFGMTECRVSRR